MLVPLLLHQVTGTSPQQLTQPFLQAQNVAQILGALVVIEAGVIGFLFWRKEQLAKEHAKEIRELQELRLVERDMRLKDALENQKVLLEMSDQAHEQNAKRNEVFERVLAELSSKRR